MNSDTRHLVCLVTIATIVAATAPASAQTQPVQDLPNLCPYYAYLTQFSTPKIENYEYHGQSVPGSWWGLGSVSAFAAAHVNPNLPMTLPYSFLLGQGGHHGHWRFQRVDPDPEVMMQVGTSLSGVHIPVPAERHLAYTYLDVWLGTADPGCGRSSRFVASSHPSGRVQHLVQLAQGATGRVDYTARMDVIYEQLPGASSAWRLRSGAGSGTSQQTIFESAATFTPTPSSTSATQGSYVPNWTATIHYSPPDGTTFSTLFPRFDTRLTTTLNAVYAASIQTEATLQTGNTGAQDHGSLHFALLECDAHARTCWGGVPLILHPETRPESRPRRRPNLDSLSGGAVTAASPWEENCSDFHKFRRSF